MHLPGTCTTRIRFCFPVLIRSPVSYGTKGLHMMLVVYFGASFAQTQRNRENREGKKI